MYDALTLLITRPSLDELVPVYVVLQAQDQDGAQLRSYISRLDINVEAQAFSSARQEPHKDQSPSPSRDIIWSGAIDAAHESSIFASKTGIQGEGPWSYVVWKIAAHISE